MQKWLAKPEEKRKPRKRSESWREAGGLAAKKWRKYQCSKAMASFMAMKYLEEIRNQKMASAI
jgi:hypothetical protein